MQPPPRLPPILRSKFIAGLVILLPILITGKALWWLFSYLHHLARLLAVPVHRLPPHKPPLRGGRGGGAGAGRDRDRSVAGGRGEPDPLRGRLGPGHSGAAMRPGRPVRDQGFKTSSK